MTDKVEIRSDSEMDQQTARQLPDGQRDVLIDRKTHGWIEDRTTDKRNILICNSDMCRVRQTDRTTDSWRNKQNIQTNGQTVEQRWTDKQTDGLLKRTDTDDSYCG